ncbi:MAG: flavodoxin family protein [Oscillibacter sp.]|nr:flavodoxin family protein [Oscillibacter sp.]
MAWNNILCVYYSRTGNTKRAMEEIAHALNAELVELRDGVDRGGWRGWLRCGRDAVRRSTPKVECKTQWPLMDYRLVIIGSPIWAGRCSSVVRGFLKQNGKEIRNASYVVTRGSEDRSEDVFRQMDMYTPCGHRTAVSLRAGSVGYAFWQEEFLRQTREILRENQR